MHTHSETTLRAEYALVVVKQANELLAANERADLSRITRENISGGHGYFDDLTHEVFKNPQTLEEGLLALELRTVLVRAARNILYDLIETPPGKRYEMRNVTNLTLLFNIGLKLAVREPYIAGQIKSAVHVIAEEQLGTGLLTFIEDYAGRYSAYTNDPTGYL